MVGFEDWEPPQELKPRTGDHPTVPSQVFGQGEAGRVLNDRQLVAGGQQIDQPVRRAAPGLPSEQYRRTNPDVESSYGLNQDPFGLSGDWIVDSGSPDKAQPAAPQTPPVPPVDNQWHSLPSPKSSSLVEGLDSDWPAPTSPSSPTIPNPGEPQFKLGSAAPPEPSIWGDLPSADEAEPASSRASSAVGFWMEDQASSPAGPGLSRSTVVEPDSGVAYSPNPAMGAKADPTQPTGFNDLDGGGQPPRGDRLWQTQDYKPAPYVGNQISLIDDRSDGHNVRPVYQYGDDSEFDPTMAWRSGLDELLETRWFTPAAAALGVVFVALMGYGVVTAFGGGNELTETVDSPSVSSTGDTSGSRSGDARSTGAPVQAVPSSDLGEDSTTTESTEPTSTSLDSTSSSRDTTTTTTEPTTTTSEETTTTTTESTTTTSEPTTTTSEETTTTIEETTTTVEETTTTVDGTTTTIGETTSSDAASATEQPVGSSNSSDTGPINSVS